MRGVRGSPKPNKPPLISHVLIDDGKQLKCVSVCVFADGEVCVMSNIITRRYSLRPMMMNTMADTNITSTTAINYVFPFCSRSAC